MSSFIGVDISTTATKALLMDEQGKVIAVAFSHYEFETPIPYGASSNPIYGGKVQSKVFARFSHPLGLIQNLLRASD